MTRLSVIVNRQGGTAARLGDSLEPTLRDAFAATGAAVDIRLLDGAEMPKAIAEAATRGRVVVAGGDGTISCAAGELQGGDAELAILPLGTLNHLAKDLDLPTGLAEAAKVAADGRSRAIDVAAVNDHVFVNNASIGLYPLMVREREEQQDDKGWPKWLASLPAGWAALHRLPQHRLTLEFDGSHRKTVTTPLLFIGNNAYSLDAGEVGKRATLTGGKLSVYAVAHRSRMSLIWFALRTIAGRAERRADFEALGECDTLDVTLDTPAVDVAIDGEVQRMTGPLRFAIHPRALKVVR